MNLWFYFLLLFLVVASVFEAAFLLVPLGLLLPPYLVAKLSINESSC